MASSTLGAFATVGSSLASSLTRSKCWPPAFGLAASPGLIPFRGAHSLHTTRRRLTVVAQSPDSERASWFPGSTPPAHLDGTLPGDFGFDPLGLGSEPETLRWLVQAELIHARFAMLGVAGILYTDLLRITGLKNLPVWYEAGAIQYDIADTRTLFAVQLLLFGFVETKRYMDFKNPGSQGKESSWFFGIEGAFEGLSNGYPGGPIFDPAGLARNDQIGFPMKVKEIKNGRLAMLAALGFFVQAHYTHAGPIENLLAHLSDPGHITVIQTLSKL